MAHRLSKRTGTLAAALALAGLAGAACSSDDTVVAESSAEPAAESTAAAEPTTTAAAEEPAGIDRSDAVGALIGLVEASGGSGGFFSDDEVRCWAEAVVDDIGLEAFAGLESGEGAAAVLSGEGVEVASDEEAPGMDLWVACIDAREQLREILTEGSGREMADCVADAAGEELAYGVAVAPFLFDEPLSPETEAEYYQLLADCGVEGLG